MIYAIRLDGQMRTLVEVQSDLDAPGMSPVSTAEAVRWVLAGGLHETGLWVDIDNGVRTVHYAEPEA